MQAGLSQGGSSFPEAPEVPCGWGLEPWTLAQDDCVSLRGLPWVMAGLHVGLYG